MFLFLRDYNVICLNISIGFLGVNFFIVFVLSQPIDENKKPVK